MTLKISYRKLSIVVLSVMIVLALLGMRMASKIRDFIPASSDTTSSKFYPMLLCGLIAFFCFLSLIETILKKEDKEIIIPKFQNYLITLGIIFAWVALWIKFSIFYYAGLVAVLGMLLIFNPEPFSLKKLFKSIAISVAIIGFFYLVFKVGLKIKL